MKQLVCIFLLLNSAISYGQSKQLVDSLKNELHLVKEDSSRAMLLSELAFQYRVADKDTAMNYAQQALTLSRKIDYKRAEASALNNIGFLFRANGHLPQAMEYHLKVLRMAREYNFPTEGGLAMMRLGNVYRDLKDYPQALFYQHQARVVFEETGYKRGLAIVTMLIANTFQDKNQLDSATYYGEIAKALMDEYQFPEVGTTLLGILGIVQAKKGNYQLALNYYRQALDLCFKVKDYRTMSSVCTYVAQVYQKLKQTDSSIYYAQEALSFAERNSDKYGILNAATILSEIYEPVDIKKAFQFQKLEIVTRDSLYNNEKLLALQTMTFDEKERERNFEIARAGYRTKIRQYALLGGLAVLIIIALILYRNNRQKNKTNTFLQKTLVDLKSTQAQLVQSEKMASLGELTAGIAHEIQNPLNFVNNFAEVNNELLQEMKEEINNGNFKDVQELIDDVMENGQKINYHGKRADAIVKGMLQHSRSSTGQNELTDINTMADEYLRLAYHGFRAKDKSFIVTLKTELDPQVGSIHIIPQDIGRVLINLFNNAFYAVTEKKKQSADAYEPTVTLCTKKANDKIEIQVKDNGSGIPPGIIDKIFQPFFTTKPTGQGTGLGLSLAYDILKAHGGELKVTSVEGQGTSFSLEIPAM